MLTDDPEPGRNYLASLEQGARTRLVRLDRERGLDFYDCIDIDNGTRLVLHRHQLTSINISDNPNPS